MSLLTYNYNMVGACEGQNAPKSFALEDVPQTSLIEFAVGKVVTQYQCCSCHHRYSAYGTAVVARRLQKLHHLQMLK